MGRIILAIMALGLLSGCYYEPAPPPAYPYYGGYYAAPGYYAPYPAYYGPAYGGVYVRGRWR